MLSLVAFANRTRASFVWQVPDTRRTNK